MYKYPNFIEFVIWFLIAKKFKEEALTTVLNPERHLALSVMIIYEQC